MPPVTDRRLAVRAASNHDGATSTMDASVQATMSDERNRGHSEGVLGTHPARRAGNRDCRAARPVVAHRLPPWHNDGWNFYIAWSKPEGLYGVPWLADSRSFVYLPANAQAWWPLSHLPWALVWFGWSAAQVVALAWMVTPLAAVVAFAIPWPYLPGPRDITAKSTSSLPAQADDHRGDEALHSQIVFWRSTAIARRRKAPTSARS